MAYEIETVNEGNIDTPLTVFPTGIDTFPRMSDVSITTLPLVLQYNTYYQSGNLTAANQLVLNNPELAYCMFTAKGQNELRDAVIAIEYYLLNQVDELYNNVAQNAIGVNDNPEEEQMSIVAYSAGKVNDLVTELSVLLSDHVNAVSAHTKAQVGLGNVDNTADIDKNVKHATSAAKLDVVDSTPTSGSENMVTSDGIYSALMEKQDNPTGAVTNVVFDDLTANTALISDADGKIAASAITTTELGYLDGVTSNIQTQLGNKYSSTESRTKNTVLAAPNGSNGAATFRALVAADIPSLAASKISAGTLAGKVVANATAVATLTNTQVRNIHANTSAMTAGTSGLTTGNIYFQYKST